MTLNDLCSRISLPAVVSGYGMGSRYSYHRLPGYGWYGKSLDTGNIFNFLDLFKYHNNLLKANPDTLIQSAYRYYTEHPELLEAKMPYSETIENKLIGDYRYANYNAIIYKRCREEALHGNIRYNEKLCKFSRLLADLGMAEFLNAGIGLMPFKLLTELKALKIPVSDSWANKVLIPSFFSPDNRLCTLAVCPVQDISQQTNIYKNREFGWYGKFGEQLVGGVKDLLTVNGCTWDKKLCYWDLGDKPIAIHHSIQSAQAIDIWVNSQGLTFTKNPLEVLKETQQLESIKDHLKDLSLTKVRELEKITGQPLYDYWLAQRYAETTIAGTTFSCRDGRYYYRRGNTWLEFTNFAVNLTKVCKEDGEWMQLGQILMNEEEVEFKIKRKAFLGFQTLLEALTETLLEAGVGVPMIAPNLKHYMTNVIYEFNSENRIEKPAIIVSPAIIEEPIRNISTTL